MALIERTTRDKLREHLEQLTFRELYQKYEKQTSWRECKNVMIEGILSCEDATVEKMLAEFEDEA